MHFFRYHEHVSEVLTSVQKTEESLRRFKKIRDPSSNENKVNSDDDKIRMQLQIDIQAYIKMVCCFFKLFFLCLLSSHELDDAKISLNSSGKYVML